ncbi:C39 family peptidase [Serratia sp. TSA_105.2]|uniref:C39 family peptidase n=1 Tax=Serratia sp. TSA_105.2 TaxID=3415660 RepID=UPI004046A3AF
MNEKSVVFILGFSLVLGLYSEAFAIERPRDKVKEYFSEAKTKNIERQLFDNSCGIASLAFVLNKYYDKSTSEKNLFFFIGLKPEYSLGDLKKTANTFNIVTVGLKIKLNELKRLKSPAILKTSTNGGHFIVYTGYKDGWFQVVDPAKGRMNYFESELEKIFKIEGGGHGAALVFISNIKNNFDDKILYTNSTNRLFLEK